VTTKGRKPLPSKIKELQGTARADRKNNNEPDCDAIDKKCPTHIKGNARKEWNRMMEVFEHLGLLTKMDRSALEQYCVCYGRWIDVEKEIQEHGTIELSEKGVPFISPRVNLSSMMMKQMRSYLSEFGMTPSSRTRLNVDKPTEEDEFDTFLKAK
jgi:P27 family predicted phage terminase small subunit